MEVTEDEVCQVDNGCNKILRLVFSHFLLIESRCDVAIDFRQTSAKDS